MKSLSNIGNIRRSAGALGLVAVIFACVPQLRAVRVDGNPAFSAPGYAVSTYLVEKEFGRFAESVRQAHHPLTNEDIAAWRRRFIAREIVTARLVSLGYDKRPEVVNTVNQMERVMLTECGGPFYEALAKENGGFRPLQFRRWANLPIGAEIYFFRDGADTDRLLGSDFAAVSTEAQTERIERCHGLAGVESFASTFAWPYAPYCELAQLLQSGPLDRWIRWRQPRWGEYRVLIHVRDVAPTTAESSADATSDYWLKVRFEQSLQRERLIRLLPEAAFAYEEDTGAAIASAFQKAPPAMGKFHPLPPAVGRLPLCQFRVGPDVISVNADAFVRHYNSKYVHEPLQRPIDVRHDAEDMVLEELDYREARNRGIDRTPQFVEDRAGFTALQILDLYERETLDARMHVAADDSRHTLRRKALDAMEAEMATELLPAEKVVLNLPDLSALARGEMAVASHQ